MPERSESQSRGRYISRRDVLFALGGMAAGTFLTGGIFAVAKRGLRLWKSWDAAPTRLRFPGNTVGTAPEITSWRVLNGTDEYITDLESEHRNHPNVRDLYGSNGANPRLKACHVNFHEMNENEDGIDYDALAALWINQHGNPFRTVEELQAAGYVPTEDILRSGYPFVFFGLPTDEFINLEESTGNTEGIGGIDNLDISRLRTAIFQYHLRRVLGMFGEDRRTQDERQIGLDLIQAFTVITGIRDAPSTERFLDEIRLGNMRTIRLGDTNFVIEALARQFAETGEVNINELVLTEDNPAITNPFARVWSSINRSRNRIFGVVITVADTLTSLFRRNPSFDIDNDGQGDLTYNMEEPAQLIAWVDHSTGRARLIVLILREDCGGNITGEVIELLEDTPTPSATSTATHTPPPSATATETPPHTLTPSSTPTSTPTQKPPTKTPTPTASPTVTPTQPPTTTPRPSITPVKTGSPTPTQIPTTTPRNTLVPKTATPPPPATHTPDIPASQTPASPATHTPLPTPPQGVPTTPPESTEVPTPANPFPGITPQSEGAASSGVLETLAARMRKRGAYVEEHGPRTLGQFFREDLRIDRIEEVRLVLSIAEWVIRLFRV